MSDPSGPLLSVSGEARRTVAPDYAILAGAISASRPAKPDAVTAVAQDLDRLIADLAQLGGVALGPESGRRPLTWSAQSATTHPERDYNEETRRDEPTGRVIATVAVLVGVRAFEMLDALGAVLTTHETLSVHDVTWGVDWDNPAWPAVRAAAIQAATGKGRDYAAALGGSLVRVEHIADAGLLGGGDGAAYRLTGAARGARAMPASVSGGQGDQPSLDPVPQELTAAIEARFTAAGVSLPEA